MIFHCTRFTIKPGVAQETADGIIAGMRVGNSADSSSLFGRDVGGEYEYGAISVSQDLDAYEAMMNDPAHLEVDRAGLPLIEEFMSFDISDDSDPEFAEKIAAIHQRRFDAHSDLVELIDNLTECTGSAAPGRHAI